jgi:crotonobetainyl-CoA:carnitine CoA-transferase CaiB-like acyl-CoA transferase
MTATAMLEQAWAALEGDPDRPAGLTVTGGFGADGRATPLGGSAAAVGELASATAGAALLAAADLAEARGLGRAGGVGVALDAAHVAAAFTSERHVTLDGVTPGPTFDPLSAFMATRDGWIRLHANYPHHRAALVRALGHPRDGAAGVPAAVAERGAEELEAAVVNAGGCAAALRDRDAWRASEPGAVAAAGLLDFEPGVAHSVRGLPPVPDGTGPERPMAGLRVLDLTRVIAGPVGTRTLAALGAQVLRVDPPLMAELPLLWIDGGVGKRSVHLQLRNRPDRERLHRLLDDTDVLVTGYRVGALDPFGLSRETLEEKHPHLCTVRLSAWGAHGPWAARRGFDSLVQSATGIALQVSPDGGLTPGTLPAQALDHGTGQLIAAAALRALTLRARDGRPCHVRVALARTATWLLDQEPPRQAGAPMPAEVGAYMDDLESPLGAVRCVRPPGTIDGRPLRWATGPAIPGADAPYWR